MKRISSLLFFLFSGIFQLHAQAPKSSLLWEISGNGLEQSSYLFGTFHLMCKSDFSISDVLKNKLAQTKQFYGEVKIDDPALQQKIMASMIMPGKTIQSFMSDPEYKEFCDSFQKNIGTPFTMFNNFKPFMALSIIMINTISCEEKIQPESEFSKLAEGLHIPVLGLETVEDEMKAVDKIPLDSQVNEIRQTVLHFDSTKREMVKFINAYKKRNIDTLYSYIANAPDGNNFEKDLVIARNHNWLPVIIKAMTGKPSFFAVGAGHLGGTEGVISLLRKQGYRVTPVKF